VTERQSEIVELNEGGKIVSERAEQVGWMVMGRDGLQRPDKRLIALDARLFEW
jgi:hypothetical protein